MKYLIKVVRRLRTNLFDSFDTFVNCCRVDRTNKD